MNTQTIVGGARFGLWNATWPFARLVASQQGLHLKVWGIKSFEFPATRVTGLTKHVSIPFIGWGVRISHDIAAYPQEIIFWTLGRPEALLKRILEAGFIENGALASENQQSEQVGASDGDKPPC